MPEGDYGLTTLYLALRSAERFGMAPREWARQTPVEQQRLLDYEQLRQGEEVRALRIQAGIPGE